MDSITQVLLGAAVGEATLGHKVGNRAVLWGGLAGLIPDLDVYFPPNQEALQWIVLHRGITHSIVFAIVFGLLMGYLISKIHKRQPADWKDWWLLAFLGLFTHALLDSLTVFGTQLFLPFSNYRVELGSIAFRDYIYSAILLITIISVLFFSKKTRTRTLIRWSGISLSCGYLLFAGINKLIVTDAFKNSLNAEGVEIERFRSGPQIYTSWEWYGLAETDKGFYTAYKKVFSDDQIRWEFIKKNRENISAYQDNEDFQKLEWFTKGYYFTENIDGIIKLNDLRFGNPRYGNSDRDFVFSFIIEETREGLDISFARDH